MTDSQKKVLAVGALMKPEYRWFVYGTAGWIASINEPRTSDQYHFWEIPGQILYLDAFNPPPYEGNWQDSLVDRNAKDGE
jgi:hypothetical protein